MVNRKIERHGKHVGSKVTEGIDHNMAFPLPDACVSGISPRCPEETHEIGFAVIRAKRGDKDLGLVPATRFPKSHIVALATINPGWPGQPCTAVGGVRLTGVTRACREEGIWWRTELVVRFMRPVKVVAVDIATGAPYGHRDVFVARVPWHAELLRQEWRACSIPGTGYPQAGIVRRRLAALTYSKTGAGRVI